MEAGDESATLGGDGGPVVIGHSLSPRIHCRGSVGSLDRFSAGAICELFDDDSAKFRRCGGRRGIRADRVSAS